MIIRFFDSGISKGASPINYLLSEKDSKGKIRQPAPVVLSGDPELTKILIDSNPNKYKYTSGAIAFRDNEHPSNKDIAEVIKSLRETFAPGLDQNSVNFLFVLHRDKGNDEVHFIACRQELKTGKAFNMMPPGKASQELARNWQAHWNHKLGFEQVVEDPLKAIFSDVDKKVAKFMSPQSLISKRSSSRAKLSTVISEKIRTGEFRNRDDMLEFFKGNGLQITRTGKDYISIKSSEPNTKAIRLRGPVYSDNANYADLMKRVDVDKAKHAKLTETEAFLVKLKIDRAVADRETYNKNRYQKRKTRTYVLPGQPKPVRSKSQIKTATKDAISQIVGRIEKARENSSKIATSINIERKISEGISSTQAVTATKGKSPKQASNSQNATGGSSGGGQGLASSLAAIEVQIGALIGQMNSAKTPEEATKIRYRLFYLNRRKMEIELKIEEEKKRQLNFSGPKPPGFK